MTTRNLQTALTEERVSLKELLENIIANNEKRFTDRFESLRALIDLGSNEQKEAVKTAFESQKEAISAALLLTKEAIIKAEIASEKRFDSISDAITALSMRQEAFLPRLQADIKFDYFTKALEDISKEVVSLREFRSQHGGKSEGYKSTGGIVAAVFAIIIAGIAMVRSFFRP